MQLLQLHRPVSVGILAMDADGSNYQRVGFVTPDGTILGKRPASATTTTTKYPLTDGDHGTGEVG